MNRADKRNISTAFLNKLWKLVNDPVTDDLIKWSLDGASFIIQDQAKFSQELIPKYFKHNNMASFIRQLNLYGFRKVSSIESGGLTIDKGEMEFSHLKFIKGQPTLIENIKRKPQGSRVVAVAEGNPNLNEILTEVQKLKVNQDSMNVKMNDMRKEKDLLWREYTAIRQKFNKQQRIIQKLVHFLLSMVKSQGQHIGTKWKFNHRALEATENSASKTMGAPNMSLQYESSGPLPIMGPVIHEITHLDERDQVISSGKSFPNSTITSMSSKTKPYMNNFSLESRPNDPLKVFKVEPESIVLVEDFFDSSDSSIPASNFVNSDLPVNNNDSNRLTFTNAAMDFDPIQLITENKTNTNPYPPRKVTVQSPNGTFLHPDISPSLSPELLETADPSVINPNIVVNVPDVNVSANITPSRTSRGKNWVTVSEGKFSKNYDQTLNPKAKHEKMLSEEDGVFTSTNEYPDYFDWNSVKSNTDTGTASGIFSDSNSLKISRGKNWPKNGKNEHAEQKPSSRQDKVISGGNVSFNTNNYPGYFSDDRTTSASYEVAVPEKSVDRDELINHVDDVQLSLDSLKDMFSVGNINLSFDMNTLISLFGNEDDQLATISDPIANDSDVLGNEVSLYNPSLYDITAGDGADTLNFASLVDEEYEDEDSSPLKKLKLGTAHANQDDNDEDGFTTPKPHQLPFNFKTN